MARLQFQMRPVHRSLQDRGVITEFTDGKGNTTSSWWSSPPDSIDHVDITYLQGRHGNVRTKEHEKFIKKRFKEEMERFEEYETNRFRLKGHKVTKKIITLKENMVDDNGVAFFYADTPYEVDNDGSIQNDDGYKLSLYNIWVDFSVSHEKDE